MHTYNSICNIYTNMKSQRCEFRILDDEHMSNYQQTTTKLLLLSVKQLIWVQQQIEPPCWHCLFQLSNQPSPVSSRLQRRKHLCFVSFKIAMNQVNLKQMQLL